MLTEGWSFKKVDLNADLRVLPIYLKSSKNLSPKNFIYPKQKKNLKLLTHPPTVHICSLPFTYKHPPPTFEQYQMCKKYT